MFKKLFGKIQEATTSTSCVTGENYSVVIAIDFGTTFSGYAFSMKSDKNDIRMNKNWGADAGFQGYKTPTSILLKPDGSTQSFGFQAESDFSDLDTDERKDKYLLFQRFKMELFSQKKLDSTITIESSTGQPWPALDIIAKSLEFMKNHSLDAISKSMASPVPEEYVRWVITVPAIWSDTAKKFMRLAAKKAGLVNDILSQNLVIALEPEAASLYCRTLTTEKFVGKSDNSGVMSIQPGEKYIIVDCGGGTIDITIHEATPDGKAREVVSASGGPWGGIFVDKQYYQLLNDIFGTDFMNNLKCYHPSTWLRMYIDFETKKRGAKSNTKTVNVNISHELAKLFKKYCGVDIEERIKMKKPLGVKFANGMLCVSCDILQNMFEEVTNNIRTHLRDRLDEMHDQHIEKMFVVGGFAESAYLQELLNSEFSRDIKIYIPEEAGMCVMKGAVLFGHDTEYISSRIARFNYGVPFDHDFMPFKHDESKMVDKFGSKKIVLLKTLVNKGQRVRVSDIVEQTCELAVGQKSALFPLMSTETTTDDPEHPSVTLLETINMINANISKKRRKMTLSLQFGGTDILMKVHDHESGQKDEVIVQI